MEFGPLSQNVPPQAEASVDRAIVAKPTSKALKQSLEILMNRTSRGKPTLTSRAWRAHTAIHKAGDLARLRFPRVQPGYPIMLGSLADAPIVIGHGAGARRGVGARGSGSARDPPPG